jgi:phosphoribosylformimino-5-aminoimidazole carboxamide ribotide isomerase
MRVLPVLDLLAGQVVRGIAGQRHLYYPWISPLADSSDPYAVAHAFRHKLGLTTLYLADLDAIAGSPPNLAIYRELHASGLRLWVDAGLQESADAARLLDAGVARIIAGLETLASPQVLAESIEQLGDRLVFSLDLKAGVPLTNSTWPDPTPLGIAKHAIALGVTSILLLDLTRVGIGQGTGTDELAATLRQMHPHLELTTGGGVRDRADLERLATLGVDNVLVASALHDGRIGAADIAALSSPSTAR